MKMITKELLIKILLTKDYLWDIIDNFIDMNSDRRAEYFISINTIYQNTLNDFTANHNKFELDIYEVSTLLITIVRIIGLLYYYLKITNKANQNMEMLKSIEKLLEYGIIRERDHLINIRRILKYYQHEYIKLLHNFNFSKIYSNFANINLLLFVFKDKIYVSQEFINIFADKVAEYIYIEIANGNCSQEFITYINTFLA